MWDGLELITRKVQDDVEVAVPVVRIVRRAVVDHRLVDGVARRVREDASREARHAFLHVVFVRRLREREDCGRRTWYGQWINM